MEAASHTGHNVLAWADTAEPQPQHVIAMAHEYDVRIVDFKFTDLPGSWQHVGMSVRTLDEDVFEGGRGFDGSSIRGFQEITESDMVLVADPTTALIDPFHEQPTMSIICSVFDPITREPYGRDPRYVAQKAEGYLLETGIADTRFIGPEAEFFIFDHVAYDQTVNRAYDEVDTHEGFWSRGAGFGTGGDGTGPNLGYKLRPQEGYFPAPPSDTHSDLRARMVLTLEDLGIECEFHHHEVSAGGQAEIDIRFDRLLRMSDKLNLQVRGQERRPRGGQDGHLHAEAAVRGERLGDACPPVALQRQEEPDVRRRRVRPALADGAPLHRRHHQAWTGTDGILRADDELVPPADARLRGAGQPLLQPAQPLRRGADTDVLQGGGGEANRVPSAGPDREPLSRLLGADDGRPRWDPERDRPR